MRKSDDRACIEYGLCHHMYHNDKKGRMHMLELIKITKKFGDFYALKDGSQQSGNRQFLLTVNVRIHDVVDVGGKLNPRTLERDDTG